MKEEENLEKILQTLAIGVHSALVTLHSIGVIYNVLRKNKFDTLVHTTYLIYDAYSVFKHYQIIQRK